MRPCPAPVRPSPVRPSPARQKSRPNNFGLATATMEKLLPSGAVQGTIPEGFILPPEKRPSWDFSISSVTLPVINLHGGERREVVEQIMKAGKEFGFLQVVNHGVTEEVIDGVMRAMEEFFQLPTEDKAIYSSKDTSRSNRLFSGTVHNKRKEICYWRDCLKLSCFPVEEAMVLWPDKPAGFRDRLANFIVETRGVAMELLKMICEGLGLEEDYFEGDLSGGELIINANYYALCPDPSLTLGLPPHCDRNLITLLIQGSVSGLQILHNDHWIAVDPVPNAFVVNFGHQLEIITNGILKSVEHRAVTNSYCSRTSLATFVMPTMDAIIAPAKYLVSENNPPLYKSFVFKEFLSFYTAAEAKRGSMMETFKINSN